MKVLISAGATRERIDPVRFISNRSSGKMGYALAEAALAAGHDVFLVSGPASISPPDGVTLTRVETAAEMFCEIRKLASKADLIIMAAAVADYKPIKSSVSNQKIKKDSSRIVITLEKTRDILAEIGKKKSKTQIIVGFAAETEKLLANAKKKLQEKNLDWIIANDVSQKDIGFDSDFNAVVMLSRDGKKINLLKDSKKKLAVKIFKIISNPDHR